MARNQSFEIKSFMNRALELAELGRGQTAPNPMVGAVIVKSGKIVGEGYHKQAGGRHAEIAALKKAGAKSRGATMFVTLEPCCHTGRTGPCTEAIVKAGIKEVRYALKDPNPLVAGKGAKVMRESGVKVTVGPLQNEARALNEIYLNRFNANRPFVILKSAQTLDGRIACSNGHSQWISGAESLRLAHRLRAEVDAVVLGAGSVSADNPRLTVRLVEGVDPYRIVLSTKANLSSSLKLFKNNKDRKTILVTSMKALPENLMKVKGLSWWSVKRSGRHLDISDFLSKAWDFGINSILVEGGGALATDFLRLGLVDKHMIIIAPKTLGSGINAVADLGSTNISEAISYQGGEFKAVGDDMMFSGYPRVRERAGV